MALGLAFVSALLVAAALRLPSLVSTPLVAYDALVGNMAFATWTLSPFRALSPTALALEEAVLLLGALTAWWLRGRPGLGLRRALGPAGLIARDPVSACFVAVAVLALAYELLLAVTVPPTNWDSLTYHLARVAAWKQHHGIFWIPNAPTARMNEFQPLAEQEILFVLVACGTTVLYALLQYV